jgi:hypothetical protein
MKKLYKTVLFTRSVLCYILSDSQAAIKALDKHQITSKLVWDCHQSLTQLAKQSRVQLIWVSGHEAIVGNETADKSARTGSEHPFRGPEPACGISSGGSEKAVRDWTNRNPKKLWESVTGLTQTKGLVQGSFARRTNDLLEINRDQLRWVVELLTGHLSPKRTLFQIGID